MLTPKELINALKEGRYTVVEAYLKHTYFEDKEHFSFLVESLCRLSKKRADNFMKESKRYFSIVLAV